MADTTDELKINEKDVVKFEITDVDDDYCYTYKEYINDKLVKEGKQWYKDIKTKQEKKAWKKAVVKYKKDNGIKMLTDKIVDKINDVKEIINKLDDGLPVEFGIDIPHPTFALPKLSSDPCEFISQVAQTATAAVDVINGLPNVQETKEYLKTQATNNITAAKNYASNAIVPIVKAASNECLDELTEDIKNIIYLSNHYEEFVKSRPQINIEVNLVLNASQGTPDFYRVIESNYTSSLGLSKSTRDINLIIVHCTATQEGQNCTVDQIRQWHIKDRHWSDIGYHYVIYLDGTIHNGRNVNQIGSHCEGHNEHSIGVCYVGGCEKNNINKPKDTRTQAQKNALKDLLSELLALYPKAKIRGHRDFSSKACPSFDATSEYKNLQPKSLTAITGSGIYCNNNNRASLVTKTTSLMKQYLNGQNKTISQAQLKPEDFVEASCSTGFNLAFMLAQGWNESHWGTMGASLKTHSVFGVGAYDNGKHVQYANALKALYVYINVVKTNYLQIGKIGKQKTYNDLLKNYINYQGNYYASSHGEYERLLTKTYNKMCSLLS